MTTSAPTLRLHLLPLAALLLAGPALRAQQLDPTFHAPLFAPSSGRTEAIVQKVIRQADGRYLVAGQFTAVDGHSTPGLARLLSDGRVDTTFTHRAGPTASTHNWMALAVQADGRVLAVGGGLGLRRLLPSGRLDAAYQPALAASAGSGEVRELLVQPDGRLLIAGQVTDSLGRHGLVRLLASGRVDTTFHPPGLPAVPGTMSLTLEPNGRLVYARSGFQLGAPPAEVVRLLPSGRPDASFTFVPDPNAQFSRIACFPDGSYALAGWFRNQAVVRLLPTGARDTSFPASLDCFSIVLGFSQSNPVAALAVQPDGRVLTSGSMYVAGQGDAPLLRANSLGGTDTTFVANFIYTPNQPTRPGGRTYNVARVSDLLMEPSGRLLVAGQFAQAGGVAHSGLARLLLNNTLAAHPASVPAVPAVWPVPARGQLHVQLPAQRPARQLTLLDALGRTVLTAAPAADLLTLHTAGVPAGIYLLRVQYVDKSVSTQRVALE